VAMAWRRAPVAAGAYYEADPSLLKSQVGWAFHHPYGPGRKPSPPRAAGWDHSVVGYIVPHGALFYSGPLAALAYADMAVHGRPSTIVFLSPNHTGLGHGVIVSPGGVWATPLGELIVDEDLVGRLAGGGVAVDALPHMFEHSVEVQLPFVQEIYGSSVRIVPVVIGAADREVLVELAGKLARIATAGGKGVVVVATTNLSQYLPPREARELDEKAVKAISTGDPSAIRKLAEEEPGSLCGANPLEVLLEYAARVAAARGCGVRVRLLGYRLSSELGAPGPLAVGYASFSIRLEGDACSDSGGGG